MLKCSIDRVYRKNVVITCGNLVTGNFVLIDAIFSDVHAPFL